MFNDVSAGFLLMKDSVGVCTPSPRTLSTSLGWHQNRALAPWMSVSGATKTRSSASTGSPLPSTSESFSPETVSHMITHGIQQHQWNMAKILQLAWDLNRCWTIDFCRWWKWLCAVVGPLWWHQWPWRRMHAGLQREVLASQERLCLLEWTGLWGQHSTNPVSVHPGWLPVVRPFVGSQTHNVYVPYSKYYYLFLTLLHLLLLSWRFKST